jgi:hypothetical protein
MHIDDIGVRPVTVVQADPWERERAMGGAQIDQATRNERTFVDTVQWAKRTRVRGPIDSEDHGRAFGRSCGAGNRAAQNKRMAKEKEDNAPPRGSAPPAGPMGKLAIG